MNIRKLAEINPFNSKITESARTPIYIFKEEMPIGQGEVIVERFSPFGVSDALGYVTVIIGGSFARPNLAGLCEDAVIDWLEDNGIIKQDNWGGYIFTQNAEQIMSESAEAYQASGEGA